MLRKSIALLLAMFVGEMVAILVDSMILSNQLSSSILQTLVYVIPFGIISMFLLDQERILIFNWWWHRFWVDRELKKRYYNEMIRKSGVEILEVFMDFPNKSYIDVYVEKERHDFIDIFLKKVLSNKKKSLVVSGVAGSGKSFSVFQAAYLLLIKSSRLFGFFNPIPVILKAEDYSGNLIESIEQNLAYFTPGKDGKAFSRGTDQLMRLGKFLVILDGVEQVNEDYRRSLINEMKTLVDSPAYSKNQFVFTCRTGYVDSYFTLEDFPYDVLEVQPLGDSSVSAFINVYKEKEKDEQIIWQQLRQQEILDTNGIGRNPYWLRLMVSEEIFDKNPAVILDKGITQLLKRERSSEGQKLTWRKIDPEDTQIFVTRRILSFLAYKLISTGKYALAYRDAHQYIVSKIESEKYFDITSGDIIGLAQEAQIIDNTPNTITGEKSPVKFTHSILLNFLAACEIAINESAAIQEIVKNSFQNPNAWWSVFVLLGKLLETPEIHQRYSIRGAYLDELRKNRHLLSALFRFCLLEETSRLFDHKSLSEIRGIIFSEFSQGDISEEKLSLFWRAASLLPDGFVGLIEIKITHNLERNMRKLAEYLIQQESQLGHSTALLYSLSNQTPWRDIANKMSEGEAEKQDEDFLTFRELTADALVNQGHNILPLLLELLKVPGIVHIDFILQILGRIKDHSATSAILELIQNGLRFPEQSDGLSVSLIEDAKFGRLVKCVKTFGEIGDSEAINFLLRLLDQIEERNAFWQLLENEIQVAISKMGEDGAKALLEIVGKKDYVHAWMVSKIPNLLASIGKPALPYLRKGVDSYNSSIQISSLRAIGLLKDEESIQIVEKRVGDRDIWVQKNAIDALSMIGSQESIVALIKSTDREIRADGNFFERRKAERQILTNVWIAESLAPHCEQYFDFLYQQLDHANTNVQACAAKAFGIRGNTKIVSKIKELFDKTNNILLKNSIVEALGGIKTKEAKLALFDMVKGNQNNLLLFTSNIISIAKHGEKFAIDGLVKMVGEDQGFDVENRKRAAFALALMKNQDAVPAINKLIEETMKSSDKDKIRHVKELNGYLEIINPKVDPLLEEMLKDLI